MVDKPEVGDAVGFAFRHSSSRHAGKLQRFLPFLDLVDFEQVALECFRKAIDLYTGDFLPERRYEDWASTEQERLEVLALGTMTMLAGLLAETSPLESVRLTQRVLAVDPVWEDAYRIQMRAYQAQGNRPLALRTYRQCVEVLEREFEVEPLPETRELYKNIRGET